MSKVPGLERTLLENGWRDFAGRDLVGDSLSDRIESVLREIIEHWDRHGVAHGFYEKILKAHHLLQGRS